MSRTFRRFDSWSCLCRCSLFILRGLRRKQFSLQELRAYQSVLERSRGIKQLGIPHQYIFGKGYRDCSPGKFAIEKCWLRREKRRLRRLHKNKTYWLECEY